MKKILLITSLILSTVAAKASSDKVWVLDAKSLVSFLIANSVKPDVGNSYDLNQQEIYLSGGYNMGWHEFGPIFGYKNEDQNQQAVKTTTYGAYYRYNFVANTFTEAVIPFVRGDLLMGKVEDAAGKHDDFTWKLKGGATFFPINNTIGLSGFLAYRDVKQSGAISGKVSGFELGTEFSLYF